MPDPLPPPRVPAPPEVLREHEEFVEEQIVNPDRAEALEHAHAGLGEARGEQARAINERRGLLRGRRDQPGRRG